MVREFVVPAAVVVACLWFLFGAYAWLYQACERDDAAACAVLEWK